MTKSNSTPNKQKNLQIQILSKLEAMPPHALVSDNPTANIVILNCSYASLITGNQLVNLFTAFDGFDRVEMFLGSKPYSYVLFRDAVVASKAYEAIDCKSTVFKNIVYLTYAQEIPIFPCRPATTPAEIIKIPGLKYVPEFIDSIHAENLLQILLTDRIENQWERLNRRSVRHYGHRFDYTLNKVGEISLRCESEKSPTLPHWCIELLKQIQIYVPEALEFNQLTVNHYYPGDGIAYHCDTHSSFERIILIVSLNSDIIMEFRSILGVTRECVLAKNSLLIMYDEARYGWEHVIRPRKVDLIDGLIVERDERWSLTFRTVKTDNTICECGQKYKTLCDKSSST